MADTKLVWTSDPETARKLRESGATEPRRDAPPSEQTIKVGVDRKRRAGKTVTVAAGFLHSPEGLAKLATQLKKRCGSGGTAKDAEIEIQGDHAETVAAELSKLGYRVKK
ncbi:MAG: translation initiation factor eIF-1/SUI1-like protein [Acidobacteria bacterium]|nr:translation initiation factor eIF-1/SUI1-like protein [Acidobacteriota bacterium]